MFRLYLQLFLLLMAIAMWASCSTSSEEKVSPAPEPILSWEPNDPRFDQLVGDQPTAAVLGEGYGWSEGPVWSRTERALYFNDVPGNTLYRWTADNGVTVHMHPAGYQGPENELFREAGLNGLFRDGLNRIIACDHGNRAVMILDPKTKEKTTIIDRYEGKRFNSPNDVVVGESGHLYFTDPPYGLAGLNDSPHKEQDANGVYHLSPSGELRRITGELTFPNGIALSPDGKVLYVANSDPERAIWMSFPVSEDGSVDGSKGRLFFDATDWHRAGKPGLPDGMVVDKTGNLFATGPGGVLVFSPDGVHLGTISDGGPMANCTFGEDGKTLFITANNRLISVALKTIGLGY